MKVNKEIVEGVRVSILAGKYRKYKEGVVTQACPKVCGGIACGTSSDSSREFGEEVDRSQEF
jgi:hypothetical protein